MSDSDDEKLELIAQTKEGLKACQEIWDYEICDECLFGAGNISEILDQCLGKLRRVEYLIEQDGNEKS